MAVRSSQSDNEALAAGAGNARASQSVAETLAVMGNRVRASQSVAETLAVMGNRVRASQSVLSVLTPSAVINASQSVAAVLAAGLGNLRVSQSVATVLMRSPFWPGNPCAPAQTCPQHCAPDPYYDLLSALPPGYDLQHNEWDALWCAYAVNCFQPLTPAQALAAVMAVSGPQPVYPTSLPNLPDSPTFSESWR